MSVIGIGSQGKRPRQKASKSVWHGENEMSRRAGNHCAFI